MAQKDLEKFQTPATAFRGENGPGGPKTPKSGPFCGGFGTNGVCLWSKMRNFGFLGPGNHSGPLGKCFGRKKFFFEKNCFFSSHFWAILEPSGAQMGPNGGSRGPISWFWGLKTIWDVFLSQKFFFEKKFFAQKWPKRT